MHSKNLIPLSNLSIFRLETLEDGVFAIVMTLLIFDIKLPNLDNHNLAKELLFIWPNVITFIGTFLLLGVFWFGHRAALNLVKHADHIYHWLNLILLMFVAMIPFSASVIARHYKEHLAILIYGSNLIAISMTMFMQWIYATHNHRLVEKELPESIIYFALIRTIFSPIAYTIAILAGFVSVNISLAIFTLIPILYILPFFNSFWHWITFKKSK